MLNIVEFPEEIIVFIFDKIDNPDLSSASLTCKLFNSISNGIFKERLKNCTYRRLMITNLKNSKESSIWKNNIFFSKINRYEIIEIKALKCSYRKKSLMEIFSSPKFMCSKLIIHKKVSFDDCFLSKSLVIKNLTQLELNFQTNQNILKHCKNLVYLKLNYSVTYNIKHALDNLKFVDCLIDRNSNISSLVDVLKVDNILLRINDQCLCFSKTIKLLKRIQINKYSSISIVFNFKRPLTSKWKTILNLIDNLKTLKLNVSFNSKTPLTIEFNINVTSVHLDNNSNLKKYTAKNMLFKQCSFDNLFSCLSKYTALNSLYIFDYNIDIIKYIIESQKDLEELIIFTNNVEYLYIRNLFNLVCYSKRINRLNILICDKQIKYKHQFKNFKCEIKCINYTYDLLNVDNMLLPNFIV